MLLAWTVLITFISHTSPLSCWEENQNNHQISDYKNNTTLFQYLAFGIESDVPGNVLIDVCEDLISSCRYQRAGGVTLLGQTATV